MPIRILSRETIKALKRIHNSMTPEEIAEASSRSFQGADISTCNCGGLEDAMNSRAREAARGLRKGEKGDLIVEMGCGDGSKVRALHADGYNAVGVDVKRYNGCVLPTGRFFIGSHERFPRFIQPGSVKLLLSFYSLTFAKLEAAADEMHRVLAEDGKIVLALHHPDYTENDLLLRIKRIKNGTIEGFDACTRENAAEAVRTGYMATKLYANVFSSEDAIRQFFKQRGFNVLHVKTMKAEVAESVKKGPMGIAYTVILEKLKTGAAKKSAKTIKQ